MHLWDTSLVALVFLYGLNLAPMMFESLTSPGGSPVHDGVFRP